MAKVIVREVTTKEKRNLDEDISVEYEELNFFISKEAIEELAIELYNSILSSKIE